MTLFSMATFQGLAGSGIGSRSESLLRIMPNALILLKMVLFEALAFWHLQVRE